MKRGKYGFITSLLLKTELERGLRENNFEFMFPSFLKHSNCRTRGIFPEDKFEYEEPHKVLLVSRATFSWKLPQINFFVSSTAYLWIIWSILSNALIISLMLAIKVLEKGTPPFITPYVFFNIACFVIILCANSFHQRNKVWKPLLSRGIIFREIQLQYNIWIKQRFHGIFGKTILREFQWKRWFHRIL